MPFRSTLCGCSQTIWPGRPPGRRQITMPRRRPPLVDARRCCLVALEVKVVFVRAVRPCGPCGAVRGPAGRHRQASARLLSRIGTSSRCQPAPAPDGGPGSSSWRPACWPPGASRGGLHRYTPGPASLPPRRRRGRPGPAPAAPRRLAPSENALPGDPSWRITHPGHLYQLEGFADRADVLPGTSFRLFVSTTARSFRVRAFRMGWYGGDLARLVWTSPATPGRYQPGAKIVQPGSMAVAPWRRA